MEGEGNRQDTRKATVYDLQKLIRQMDDLDPVTVERIIKIMDDYIDISTQK